MAYIDGTALRCGKECDCGGPHKKLAEIHGTSLEILGRTGGAKHRVSVSVFDLLRLVGGTVR